MKLRRSWGLSLGFELEGGEREREREGRSEGLGLEREKGF